MGDLSNEPSMEDILSSIKRIIAEEGDGSAPRGRRITRPAAAESRDDGFGGDSVLELDHPVVPPRAEPAYSEPTRADAFRMDTPRAAPAPTAPAAASAPSLDPEMLSPRVVQATRDKLEALSRLVVKPESTAPDTLEGLVREMLKPMLSQWLDANLPQIVEAMVSREIARIAGRSDG